MVERTLITVWEGVDGSGKTTLMLEVSKLLQENGYKVVHYKTPSDTTTGKIAREVGNSPSIDPLTRMLLFLANTVDDSKVMLEKIVSENPDFFFIDRYYLCSIVYGLALISKNLNQAVDEKTFRELFRIFEDIGRGIIITPDLYVIVSVEDEEIRRRRVLSKSSSSERRFELDEELQKRVRQLYEGFHSNNPDRVILVNNEENKLGEIAKNLAEELIVRLREKVENIARQ